MTRFVSPNLSALNPPAAVEGLQYEGILEARLADLGARATAAGVPDVSEILALESEPLRIAEETNSYFELLARQRINDAVRACMVASATGSDLDHLAATFYGVQRLVIIPANPDASPPTPDVLEDDETFRSRAILSMEARSVAGPSGAYTYFALQAHADVKDAATYGEDDGAQYAGGADVIAPEVLIVVLSRQGDGTASAPLLAAVLGAVNAEEVRPIGDRVTVEGAKITEYRVEGVLKYAPGADPAVMVAEATTRIQAYAEARHRIGRVVQLYGLAAALKVTNAEEVELTVLDADGLPVTQDIDPGSKGAAFCTGITVTAEIAPDGWRP